MKILNTTLIVITVLCTSLTSYAQNSDYPVSIGLFAGPVDFFGDFDSHTVFDLGGDDSYFHFGAGLDFYANPSFDFNASISIGEIGHSKEGLRVFQGDFTALDFMFEYKLNNGYILKEDAKIAPYLMAGGGITDIRGDSAEIYNNLLSHFGWGLGFNIPLSERLSLDIRNTYKYTSNLSST